jgi:hypothetical protein
MRMHQSSARAHNNNITRMSVPLLAHWISWFTAGVAIGTDHAVQTLGFINNSLTPSAGDSLLYGTLSRVCILLSTPDTK